MSPHQGFARIPLPVGSELRIRNSGEVSVSNPAIETALRPDAAGAVLDYRFDPYSGEHVIRLAAQPAPARRKGAKMKRWEAVTRGGSAGTREGPRS